MKTRGRIQESVGNAMTGIDSILEGEVVAGNAWEATASFYSLKPINRYFPKTVKP